MKKILSLVLAVMMLASMAVSASAVKILNSEGTGFIQSSTDSKITVNELLDIYGMLGLEFPYGGATNFNGETIYTWWYDDCPECDGFSFHYVSKGTINWKCLEPKCGKTGTINAPSTDKDEDDNIYSGVTCPDCKSAKTLYIETVLNYAGNLRDRYYCTSCKEDFYTSAAHIDGDDDFNIENDVICTTCGRAASFEKFYILNSKLYARYECSKGHETDKRVYTDIDFDRDDYTVRVICSRGGDYEISGTSKAYYGEKKTIEFYPDKGYALTDVLVNGESVDVSSSNKIEITVKTNTVVRAYFEKVSNLKSYTILADSEGNGKITAKKNGETVSADKVSAKYTDTVTYKFVPASKNYYVAGVKVNGKSVGAPTSYTVSKIAGNIEIDVTFAWKNPFTDLKKGYENAVEYVTEAGIMSASRTVNKKTYFDGTVKATVKNFAAALAEMADTADKLDDTAERLAWAEKYGLIDDKTDLSATCDVQTACEMVRYFLEALEKINDISFVDLKYKDTAKETAIAIDMVTATTYEKNRKLNRYDLASVCYLVAGLEYDD